MRHRDESGQVMVLAIGLSMIVFAVAGLAIDGTKAFLLRRSLQNMADGASVAAAASLDKRVYHRSQGTEIDLDEETAHNVAAGSIETRGIPVRAAVAIDGNVVTVSLGAESQTSLLRLIGVDVLTVAASSSAVAFPQVVPNAP